MILLWNTERVPHITQKLAFNAGVRFSAGYEEAVFLKNLLRKSGGFEKNAVKLIAVEVFGALEKWQSENAIFVTRKREEMIKAVKQAMELGKSKKIKVSKIDPKKSIKVRG